MVDRDIVQSKIQTVKRCLVRVASTVPKNAVALAADVTAQDVVSINLQRAVRACVDLAVHVIADRGLRVPEGMTQAFALLHRAEADIRPGPGIHEGCGRLPEHLTKRLDDFRKYIGELEQTGAIAP